MNRLVLAVAALVMGATCAAAQTSPVSTWPTKPVRIIVPFSPGGPTDVFARLIAQKLSEQIGKQFYVENIGGAGGSSGTGRAAQAAPDGHTVLVVGGSLVINPSLYGHVPYDPLKDFDAVTLAAHSPAVLTVHPSLPARSVQELVALIRSTPGKYGYASPGTGTPPQLVGELFRLSLKLDLVHIPFNGGGPAVASAVAGHTPISFGLTAPVVQLVKDGQLRALAVTSKTRSPALPEVPTMGEAGFPEIDGVSWATVVVPAGTSKDITAQLNRRIAGILALPDIKQRLDALGYEPVGSSPEDCAAFFKTEFKKWADVIRAAGIKAQP